MSRTNIPEIFSTKYHQIAKEQNYDHINNGKQLDFNSIREQSDFGDPKYSINPYQEDNLEKISRRTLPRKEFIERDSY